MEKKLGGWEGRMFSFSFWIWNTMKFKRVEAPPLQIYQFSLGYMWSLEVEGIGPPWDPLEIEIPLSSWCFDSRIILMFWFKVADPKERSLSQRLNCSGFWIWFGSIRICAPSPLLMIANRHPMPLAFCTKHLQNKSMRWLYVRLLDADLRAHIKGNDPDFSLNKLAFFSEATGAVQHLGSTKCSVQCKEAIIASRLCIVQNLTEQWPNPAWTAPCSSQDWWSQKPHCCSELLGGRWGLFSRRVVLSNVKEESIILRHCLLEKILHHKQCPETLF